MIWYVPKRIGNDSNWTDIAVANDSQLHNFSLKSDGTLWRWGAEKKFGKNGVLFPRTPTPVRVKGIPTTQKIVGQFSMLAGLTVEGSVWIRSNSIGTERTEMIQCVITQLELAELPFEHLSGYDYHFKPVSTTNSYSSPYLYSSWHRTFQSALSAECVWADLSPSRSGPRGRKRIGFTRDGSLWLIPEQGYRLESDKDKTQFIPHRSRPKLLGKLNPR